MKNILDKFANRDIPEEPHFKKNSRMARATSKKAEDEEKLCSVLDDGVERSVSAFFRFTSRNQIPSWN